MESHTCLYIHFLDPWGLLIDIKRIDSLTDLQEKIIIPQNARHIRVTFLNQCDSVYNSSDSDNEPYFEPTTIKNKKPFEVGVDEVGCGRRFFSWRHDFNGDRTNTHTQG